jgi:hypothetical protein
MTVKQEATMILDTLPDDTVRIVLELLKQINPVMQIDIQKPDTSNRFGAGKGIITDSPIFEELDREIEGMFTGDSI